MLKTLKQLKGFLGLAGYYRRFIRNYKATTKALTELLKKDNFSQNAAAQQSFDQRKICLCTTPILGLPDLAKGFLIEIDASIKGSGTILMQ